MGFIGTRGAALVVLLGAVAPAAASAGDRGWRYLIDKLARDGVSRTQARAAFNDRRVPSFTEVEFNIEPREPNAWYRRFRSPGSVQEARGCRARYDREFRAAARRRGVPASVLSAILHVETQCGRNTGNHLILHRLARLAMANEPANVYANVQRHTRGLPQSEAAVLARRVRARAQALEERFYPEVLATFRLARRLGIDPLSLRGSGSGAFGIPQFLPSSYLRYAVDGNGDGRVSLYQPADAIASAANYLRVHGWRDGIAPARQRQVIWAYNRSDAYIDTVIFLAARIDRAYPMRTHQRGVAEDAMAVSNDRIDP